MIKLRPMKKLLLVFLLLQQINVLYCQNLSDTTRVGQAEGAAGDDPSQFFTRIELFNEVQNYPNSVWWDQTTLRINVKIGKRFTTRLDFPFVYNSLSTPADYAHYGLGDISLRLLGYQILQSKRSALTVSIEVGFNTAQSPILGTGKNMFVPMLTFSHMLNNHRTIISFVFQQANSFGGYSDRSTLSYSKLQAIVIHVWTRKFWSVAAPECYIDYVKGGLSMNFEVRSAYAPNRRINVWAQAGVGVFGDFVARYQWGAEVGCRYYFLKNTFFN
jgi:hypothetical protein